MKITPGMPTTQASCSGAQNNQSKHSIYRVHRPTPGIFWGHKQESPEPEPFSSTTGLDG